MIVDLGPSFAEKSNVYMRRHLIRPSCPASTACFGTVIRAVGVNVEMRSREDRG